jgi:hypothetical protein
MKIYSFYQSLPGDSQQEEFACANIWKGSWQHHHWEPVMLNRSHAQGSPLYNKLMQKMAGLALKLPPELTQQYQAILARFTRWCAIHAAGGGWMSDYDLVNAGFDASQGKKLMEKGTLLLPEGPANVFYVSGPHAGKCIQKFISDDLIEGSGIRNEFDILSVQPELNGGIIDSLPSPTKRGDTPRSERMKIIFETTCQETGVVS